MSNNNNNNEMFWYLLVSFTKGHCSLFEVREGLFTLFYRNNASSLTHVTYGDKDEIFWMDMISAIGNNYIPLCFVILR